MFRTVLLLIAAVALMSVAPHPSAQAASQSAAKAGAKPSRPSKPALTAPININTAGVSELDNLPGIGAKTAARIVEYRQKNGPFKRVEELMNVRGVGEKNFLKLKDHITVSPAKTAQ